MVELVRTIACALVDHPDQVELRETEDPSGGLIIELRVAPEDMGKVIGRQGRIAKAIRSVVKAANAKNGRGVMVEIM